MDDIDHNKLQAAIERLESEQERRRAERIEAGELVSVPLFIVAGSEAEARAQVEQTKADKLAELRASGVQCEVVFDVTTVATGVRRHGEAGAVAEPWKPTAPPYLPRPSSVPPDTNEEEAVPEEPQPPIIETYISVQTRQCHDDDDPGEIAEAWYSVDGRTVTVTAASGKYIGSRVMLKGEDARVVAKQLLREKVPESEAFSRRLSYPSAGLA
jgi:hypothetical protein